MTKAELRSMYKAMRCGLSEIQQKGFDAHILDHLKRMDWSNARLVHIYLPIAKSREPDTLKFMRWLQHMISDVQFVISRSDFINHTMIHYLWDEHTVLTLNSWGIMEPSAGTVIEESQLDVVLVPLLVVDIQGNRVGYGKGFYDRFLAQCKPETVSIGLSYYEPVGSISDIGEWDVPIHLCITPRSIYDFRK